MHKVWIESTLIPAVGKSSLLMNIMQSNEYVYTFKLIYDGRTHQNHIVMLFILLFGIRILHTEDKSWDFLNYNSFTGRIFISKLKLLNIYFISYKIRKKLNFYQVPNIFASFFLIHSRNCKIFSTVYHGILIITHRYLGACGCVYTKYENLFVIWIKTVKYTHYRSIFGKCLAKVKLIWTTPNNNRVNWDFT